MDNLLKTPLYDLHHKYGGKMVEFAGWALPVYYSGILDEHEAVRSRAGLFDVSHMGRIEVKGKGALRFLQMLITGDAGIMVDGKAMYSLMCYPHGGVVDDILIYRFGPEHFLVVVNASNTDKDHNWMVQNKTDDVEIINLSRDTAQLALQGPQAEKILQGLTTVNLSELRFFRMLCDIKIAGFNCLVSRTGYTGEDGFEVYTSTCHAQALWEAILQAGSSDGVVPAGLGARDTLRMEACLPLYGHELSPDITPLEAGLAKFVNFYKLSFIGREALTDLFEKGTARKLVGFEMEDRGIPRAHYAVESGGREIGSVTSGGYSPTLKKNIGLALIDAAYSKQGEKIDVIIRNKRQRALIVPTPFFKKQYRNK
ncbi:MAG: glycine cleavage system aminomethyltransferase GcvT [Desulfotomaculaceae bacterium]|nr:glycine cleavage system aminomethyltransferase GcvT [Desulfotomaculaceae bacterium]